MTTLQRALAALQQLIARGVEYPDAVWRITQQYGVTAEELETAYDNADTGRQLPESDQGLSNDDGILSQDDYEWGERP